MALLTRDIQDKVVKLLVDEGLADAVLVRNVQEEASRTKQPIMAMLVSKNVVSNELIAHATAVVMGVPYVDLKNVQIDQEILLNIPQDVAERSMVVALGEQNGALVVAMVDVTNVQATDYLSTLVQKPIKAIMSNE